MRNFRRWFFMQVCGLIYVQLHHSYNSDADFIRVTHRKHGKWITRRFMMLPETEIILFDYGDLSNGSYIARWSPYYPKKPRWLRWIPYRKRPEDFPEYIEYNS